MKGPSFTRAMPQRRTSLHEFSTNDRNPYAFNDREYRYVPDFLVRLQTPDGELKLILELKGTETEQDHQKIGAAEKWVRAVNHHGGFGRWMYLICKDRNQVGAELGRLATRGSAVAA